MGDEAFRGISARHGRFGDINLQSLTSQDVNVICILESNKLVTSLHHPFKTAEAICEFVKPRG
jgi:hypothetical protein